MLLPNSFFAKDNQNIIAEGVEGGGGPGSRAHSRGVSRGQASRQWATLNPKPHPMPLLGTGMSFMHPFNYLFRFIWGKTLRTNTNPTAQQVDECTPQQNSPLPLSLPGLRKTKTNDIKKHVYIIKIKTNKQTTRLSWLWWLWQRVRAAQ